MDSNNKKTTPRQRDVNGVSCCVQSTEHVFPDSDLKNYFLTMSSQIETRFQLSSWNMSVVPQP